MPVGLMRRFRDRNRTLFLLTLCCQEGSTTFSKQRMERCPMRSRTWTETHLHSGRRDAADGAMRVFLRGVAASFRRQRQRRDLSALSDHHLRDIGLSRTDVEMEMRQPFW